MSTFIVDVLRADHYDVKMPCHLILSKLARKCGAAVLAGTVQLILLCVCFDNGTIQGIRNLAHRQKFELDTCILQSLMVFFLLSVMDTLVEPLEKTVTHKTKPDAVKQEVDRNEDMIRSALRAIDSLNRIRYSGCFLNSSHVKDAMVN